MRELEPSLYGWQPYVLTFTPISHIIQDTVFSLIKRIIVAVCVLRNNYLEWVREFESLPTGWKPDTLPLRHTHMIQNIQDIINNYNYNCSIYVLRNNYWSRYPDSNRGTEDYKSTIFSTKLYRHWWTVIESNDFLLLFRQAQWPRLQTVHWWRYRELNPNFQIESLMN